MNDHSDVVQDFLESATDYAEWAFEERGLNERQWYLTRCMRNYQHALNIIG